MAAPLQRGASARLTWLETASAGSDRRDRLADQASNKSGIGGGYELIAHLDAEMAHGQPHEVESLLIPPSPPSIPSRCELSSLSSILWRDLYAQSFMRVGQLDLACQPRRFHPVTRRIQQHVFIVTKRRQAAAEFLVYIYMASRARAGSATDCLYAAKAAVAYRHHEAFTHTPLNYAGLSCPILDLNFDHASLRSTLRLYPAQPPAPCAPAQSSWYRSASSEGRNP